MEVYLVRHGIAAERDTYDNDEKRPLVKQGVKKTTRVAKRLLEIGLKFDLILTSPLVRALQTAEILQKVGVGDEIQTFIPLKPEGKIEQWLEWVRSDRPQHPDAKLALVGHQPDLGNWAEMLIWGTVKGQITLKKAGIIGLKLPDIGTPISRSSLFLLTSYKWMI